MINNPTEPGRTSLGPTRSRILLLIIGAALLSLAASAGYSAFKSHRAHSLIQLGRRELEAGHFQQALAHAQTAGLLRPGFVDSSRLIAQILSAAGDPRAVPFWGGVVRASDGQLNDRLDFTACAISFQQWDIAEKELSELRLVRPVPARALALSAILHDLTGSPAEAIRFAMETLDRTPDDRQMQLMVARLSANSPEPVRQKQGLAMLRSMVADTSASSIEPALILARAPMASTNDLQLVRDILLRTTNSVGRNLSLARTEVELRLGIAKLAPAAVSLRKEMASRAAKDRLEVARWLNQKGLHRETLELLQGSDWMQSRDLALVYLDAKAALGRWNEVRADLGKPNIPLPPPLQSLFKARASSELGDGSAAGLFWDQALAQATGQPLVLAYLASYAEKQGLRSQARSAYEQMLRETRTARAGFMGLIRLAEAEKDTTRLRDLMARILERFPSDQQPSNDLAYLDLLTRKNVATSTSSALKRLAEAPSVLGYRTTAALGYLRGGNPAAALLLYSGVEVDWDAVLPGWRAVHAAVLAANGRRTEANLEAARIPLPRLLPEERLLIQPLLQSAP